MRLRNKSRYIQTERGFEMTPQDLKLLHDQLNNVTLRHADESGIIDRACNALLAYADLLHAVQNLKDQKGRHNTEIAYNRLMERVKRKTFFTEQSRKKPN